MNVSGQLPAGLVWSKSSRSNGDGNVCVEVAFPPRLVAVRDSKNPTGVVLVLPVMAWALFRRTLGTCS
jgi:hypothetical protein